MMLVWILVIFCVLFFRLLRISVEKLVVWYFIVVVLRVFCGVVINWKWLCVRYGLLGLMVFECGLVS